MTQSEELRRLRGLLALLRMTVGLVLLATWVDNLTKGVYSADGIRDLFDWIFNTIGGGPGWYRALIESTVLAAPGVFAGFQLVAELLLGLGLFLGGLTPIAGVSAAIFFLNLFFAFLGGSEWIWTYVLLTIAALVAGLARSGRSFGLDQWLHQTRGEPPRPFLW